MRTLAIGDIHGCYSALVTLLDFVQPQPDDRFVTLGDYIDRGPDSKQVLDFLVALYESGRLVPLRGNHEIMMLAAHQGGGESIRFWLQCGGLATLESYGRDLSFSNVPDSHWHFMKHVCQDWHETETHVFVHANLDAERPVENQETEFLHWTHLSTAEHRRHPSGKTMVCGHTQQRSGKPLALEGTVCIDTWAYGGGWLTCLDVDSGVWWQANQDGQTRMGALPASETDSTTEW